MSVLSRVQLARKENDQIHTKKGFDLIKKWKELGKVVQLLPTLNFEFELLCLAKDWAAAKSLIQGTTSMPVLQKCVDIIMSLECDNELSIAVLEATLDAMIKDAGSIDFDLYIRWCRVLIQAKLNSQNKESCFAVVEQILDLIDSGVIVFN